VYVTKWLDFRWWSLSRALAAWSVVWSGPGLSHLSGKLGGGASFLRVGWECLVRTLGPFRGRFKRTLPPSAPIYTKNITVVVYTTVYSPSHTPHSLTRAPSPPARSTPHPFPRERPGTVMQYGSYQKKEYQEEAGLAAAVRLRVHCTALWACTSYLSPSLPPVNSGSRRPEPQPP
jgi:hypothetical protein